jgi:hypothetical protein
MVTQYFRDFVPIDGSSKFFGSLLVTSSTTSRCTCAIALLSLVITPNLVSALPCSQCLQTTKHHDNRHPYAPSRTWHATDRKIGTNGNGGRELRRWHSRSVHWRRPSRHGCVSNARYVFFIILFALLNIHLPLDMCSATMNGQTAPPPSLPLLPPLPSIDEVYCFEASLRRGHRRQV